jgi:hypothetical protein
MQSSRLLFTPILGVALAGYLLTSPSAGACPFCGQAGQTLTQEVNDANMIVFGTLSDAKRDPDEFGKGTTEMKVEMVVKDDPFLKGRKTITLPRYIPLDPKNPTKYLVFCNVFKDQLDPYRGEAVAPDSKLAEYLKGAIAIRSKDAATRLRYFFDYLDSPENTISVDAYMEFAAADFKEVAAVAPKLPAATIAKWLRDPNVQPSRIGLYGSLLGQCGNAKEHAPLLREMLDDPKKRFSSGVDGMLAGYVELDPKAGWKYVLGLIADEKQEFLVRYAALRAARYFFDYRKDLISANDVVGALELLLNQGDIADLPIEDLRKWGRWELTDKIVSLYGQKSHNIPIVKRAIIRFALSAPADNAVAAAFLKERRAEDPERVKDIEQLLELERPAKSEPKK